MLYLSPPRTPSLTARSLAFFVILHVLARVLGGALADAAGEKTQAHALSIFLYSCCLKNTSPYKKKATRPNKPYVKQSTPCTVRGEGE